MPHKILLLYLRKWKIGINGRPRSRSFTAYSESFSSENGWLMMPAKGFPLPLSYSPIKIVTHSKPEAGIFGKLVRVTPRMYSSVASAIATRE